MGATAKIIITEIIINIVEIKPKYSVFINLSKSKKTIWLIENNMWHFVYVEAWYPPDNFLQIKKPMKKASDSNTAPNIETIPNIV